MALGFSVFMRHARRLSRFTGVSVVAALLAQGGLAVAYGIFRWDVPEAVTFSLAVSVVPAYLLSRTYVWSGSKVPREAAREAGWFLLIGIAGSAVTIAIVWSAVRLATVATTDHAALTVVALVSSILATAVAWLARYAVLDRAVFRPTPQSVPIRQEISRG